MVESLFLIFTDPYHKQIYQLTASTTVTGSVAADVQGIKVPLLNFPISVEMDGNAARVYWIDVMSSEIKSSDFYGNNANVLLRIINGRTCTEE